MDLLTLLDYAGTAVFAITGALVAREKRMDLFGVIVVALVTAIGGGTLRDLILGRTPVFWIMDDVYILIGVLSAVFAFAVAHLNLLPRRPLLLGDALGLAVFSVIGTQIALDAGTTAIIAAMMGVTTATAGGIVRDLLSDRIPLILQSELYATAALAGSATYLLLHTLEITQDVVTLVAVMVALVLRLAAIRWGLSLPVRMPGTTR